MYNKAIKHINGFFFFFLNNSYCRFILFSSSLPLKQGAIQDLLEAININTEILPLD